MPETTICYKITTHSQNLPNSTEETELVLPTFHNLI